MATNCNKMYHHLSPSSSNYHHPRSAQHAHHPHCKHRQLRQQPKQQQYVSYHNVVGYSAAPATAIRMGTTTTTMTTTSSSGLLRTTRIESDIAFVVEKTNSSLYSLDSSCCTFVKISLIVLLILLLIIMHFVAICC